MDAASLFRTANLAVVAVIGADALSAFGLQLAAVIAVKSVIIIVISAVDAASLSRAANLAVVTVIGADALSALGL